MPFGEKSSMKKLLIAAGLIIVAALYFFLGRYDVSATKPHLGIVEAVFHGIAESSIRRNSKKEVNPYDVNDPAAYAKGFVEYDSMCVQCHGAPGVKPSATGKGLYPKPPIFPEEGLYEYTLEEIFWVTKNGIKMTGMPAYGPTHDDEAIWAIAIFLDRSRELTEEQYSELRRKYPRSRH